MKIQSFTSRRIQLNTCLPYFLPDRQSRLVTSLPDDDIKVLLYQPIPNTWEKKMVEQGYNYLDGPIHSTAEFFKTRIENLHKNNKNFESSMQEDLVPITFGDLIPEDEIRKNDLKNMSILQNDVWYNSRYVKILMDSGTIASIIHDSFVRTNEFNTRKNSTNKCSTMARSFLTSCEPEVKIKLLELNFTAHIFAPFHM